MLCILHSMDGRPNTILPILNSSEMNREFLVDKVYKLLEEKIITGQLPAHYKLSEHDIANALKISRSPIREALLRLENSGLVIRTKTGKRMVQSYTEKDILELYEMWHMTELYGVGAACINASNMDYEKIGSILQEMSNSIKNIEHYRKLNHEFHRCIMGSCPNAKLRELHSIILKQVNWLSHITISSVTEPATSYKEHCEIFELYKLKEKQKVELKVSDHNKNAFERLKSRINDLRKVKETGSFVEKLNIS
jgi:DNA-binding GntR family transcriptional regulator